MKNWTTRHNWIKTAAALLYPPRCPLCQRILSVREHYVCRSCSPHLPWIGTCCLRCGRALDDETKEYCDRCGVETHAFTAGRSTFLYEGALRDSVIRMKFKNHREYLDFYAAAMSIHSKSFLAQIRPAAMIPVPMHRQKRARRGFDQVRELTDILSAMTGIPAASDAAVRSRRTLPQKGLDAAQRRENLRGAFEIRGNALPKGPLLVIDDIFTTGSTIDELCRALRDAGAENLYFLTLCSAVRG